MELPTNSKDWTITIAMILVIIGAGYWAINGFIEFKYNNHILSDPCDLCLKLNENIDLCPRQPDLIFDPENNPIVFPTVGG